MSTKVYLHYISFSKKTREKPGKTSVDAVDPQHLKVELPE